MLGDSKKVYNIILEKDVKSDIDKIAKSMNRSSSNLINHVLNNYVKSVKRKIVKARKEKAKKETTL